MVVETFCNSLASTPRSSKVLEGQTLIEAPVSTKTESTKVPFNVMDMQRGRERHSSGAHSSSEKTTEGVFPLVKFRERMACVKLSAGRSALTLMDCRNLKMACQWEGDFSISSFTVTLAGILLKCWMMSYSPWALGATKVSWEDS